MRKLSFYAIISSIFLLLLLMNVTITSTVKAIHDHGNKTASESVLPDQAEQLDLSCQYPVLSSYAGTYFTYDISVSYVGGKDPKVFDLKAKVPEGFNFTIAPGYGDGKEIAAIRLDPGKGY